MNSLAENIVNFLTEAEMLLEDRMDDLVSKHGQRIPGFSPEAKRHEMERWASYDPTYRPEQRADPNVPVDPQNRETGRPARQGKYFMWMFQQFLKGAVEFDEHTLDHIRDMLSDFEHYLAMPDFEAPRDIFRYDYKSLDKTMRENSGLASKKDLKRGRERLDADVINTLGDYTLLAFKDGNSLAQEAWRAYSADNPNWDGKPITPDMPRYAAGYPTYPEGTEEPYHVDNLWCIRKPSRGADYIAKSPSKRFYVVRKHGFPYVGLEMGNWGSQIVSIKNKQIETSVVEEIFDVFSPVLDEFAKNRWEVGGAATTLFGSLRIIRGELKPGETINSHNLSGSSLRSLPASLTVNGDFNVSGTQLTELPPNLTVKGSLIVSNTKITAIPPGLKVDGSLNISDTKIKALPQGLTIGNLNISGTPISQLPSGMVINDVLNITNTAITTIPNDLVAKKILYSPETITPDEIRRYFFHLRSPALKKHFWKNEKVVGMTEEQKEAEWILFQPGLMKWFQSAPTIAQAAAAQFEAVPGKSTVNAKKRR